MAGETPVNEVDKHKDKQTNNINKRGGFWSGIWNGLFRLHSSNDFEKRLQYISKEEATLLARIKKRSLIWRSTARNLIVISVLLEVVALGYAIVTTRTVGLDWQKRALRVLPIFVLPAFSSGLYWVLFSFTRMRDSRDQKTVDRLRAERQTKIDELKERTNYYSTQQLIQKYDTDPAAKAAAASILASKLGAESGLKVFLGDELQQHYSESTGKSHDVEPVASSGLRKRNTSEASSNGGNDMEIHQHAENEISSHSQVIVEHHNPNAFGTQDGGWIARLAQLLVGEDPSQSYALICGSCHMHNGLASKEEFPFITYYCPHCQALNQPRNLSPSSTRTSIFDATSPTTEGTGLHLIKQDSGSMKASAASSTVTNTTPLSDKVSAATSPVTDTVPMIEKVSADSSPVTDTMPMSEEVPATSSPPVSDKMVTSDPSTQ